MGPVARKLLDKLRSNRGATEIGIAFVITALVAGVLVGTGMSDTALRASDGLTWLGDDKRGEVVQVNPSTGRPETRLIAAPPGDKLQISQVDGLLVVTDLTTGLVTFIDVSMLVTSGRWRGTGDGATKVLLDANQLYVADRVRGTIQRVDPANASPVGAAWSAGLPLADATLDGKGVIWALRADGQLSALRWAGASKALVETLPPQKIGGAGPRSLLVAHEQGVTVLAPEGGVMTRVGTEQDAVIAAPELGGTLFPPAQAPTGLVPVTVEATSTVVLMDGNRVHYVDVRQFGCERPEAPAVFQNRIYVACRGAGRVIVLGRDGRYLPPDIRVPEGENAILVLDDNRLIINVPGAPTGVVVEQDGSHHPINTHDGSVPVQDPGNRQPVVVPSRPPRSPRDNRPDDDRPGNGRPGSPSAPAPTHSTAPPAPPPTPTTPINVSAQAHPDRVVTVSWEPQGSPTGYRILRGDTSDVVGSAPAGARSATITSLPAGETLAFVVEAIHSGGSSFSRPSNVVTVLAPAPPPGPANGDTVITRATGFTTRAGISRITVTLNPPVLWRDYTGGCTINVQGPGGDVNQTVACNATSAVVNGLDPYTTYTVAILAGTVARSASVEVTTPDPPEPPCNPVCP